MFNKKLSFRFVYILFIILFPINVKADLGSEMDSFWDSLGGSSNSNSAYSNQSIGYYTGGSLNARVPVIQQRPFNAQLPKITAGCGGIDMFTGSFSHINLDQFVAQMKAIGANAVGYAFQIALETLSPMIASTMNKLQEVVDMINGVNINSCESAKILVDGIANRGISAKESMCAQMALISGSASDADAAKSRCRSSSAQVEENNKLADEEKVTDINFTWQAMKKDNYVDILGKETSEAFMSMVGTIVYKHDGKPVFIAPSALDVSYAQALINGGTVKIKECDESSKCLNLTEKEITISDDVAYKPKIKSLLQSMQDKISGSANGANGNSLSDSELALINQTSLPILRIMINTATGGSPITTDTISELVARDMLNKFMQNIAGSLRLQVVGLSTQNNSEDALKIIVSNIDTVSKSLEQDRENIKSNLEQVLEVINASENMDKQLASKSSGHIKSVLDFSNSLSYGGKI